MGGLGDDNDDDDVDDEDIEEEEEEGDEAERKAQLKALREHARVLQNIGDLQAAEDLLQRALVLRGELGRAEAFFRRALQLSMPGMLSCLSPTPHTKATTNNNNNNNIDKSALLNNSINNNNSTFSPIDNDGNFSSEPGAGAGAGGTRIRMKAVVRLLLDYASFLCRSRGDIEGAVALYRRAIEVAPGDAIALSSLAHLLADNATDAYRSMLTNNNATDNRSEREVDMKRIIQEADEVCTTGMFVRALKADPGNVTAVGWYAKLLRRTGRLGQAEVMYQAAVTKCSANPVPITSATKGAGVTANKHMEPTALCNYASFVCKHRKDPQRALGIFKEALIKYPKHKGLLKNYGYLLRDNPKLQPAASNDTATNTMQESIG
eukprot:gene10224-21317_t